jgi:hypothetical protein
MGNFFRIINGKPALILLSYTNIVFPLQNRTVPQSRKGNQ